MNLTAKMKAVQDAAHVYEMNGQKYGENPYTDMQIENALLCDMFPEEVPDPENFYGFKRSDHIIAPAVHLANKNWGDIQNEILGSAADLRRYRKPGDF